MVYCFNFDWDKIFSLSKKIKRNNLKVLKTVRRIDIMKLKLRCLCLTKTALKKNFISIPSLVLFQITYTNLHYISLLSNQENMSNHLWKKNHTDLFLFAQLFLS